MISHSSSSLVEPFSPTRSILEPMNPAKVQQQRTQATRQVYSDITTKVSHSRPILQYSPSKPSPQKSASKQSPGLVPQPATELSEASDSDDDEPAPTLPDTSTATPFRAARRYGKKRDSGTEFAAVLPPPSSEPASVASLVVANMADEPQVRPDAQVSRGRQPFGSPPRRAAPASPFHHTPPSRSSPFHTTPQSAQSLHASPQYYSPGAPMRMPAIPKPSPLTTLQQATPSPPVHSSTPPNSRITLESLLTARVDTDKAEQELHRLLEGRWKARLGI